MRDYRDAKAMARRLREALAQRDVSLTHTDCLELIARSFGLKDWQVLAAMIEADARAGPAAAPPPAPTPTPTPTLWRGPLLPMRDIVMFPKLSAPLFIGRERSRRAMAAALAGEQELFLVAQRDPADEQPAQAQLYEMGVIADVLQRTDTPDRGVKLLLRGRERARLVTMVEADGQLRAEAAPAPSPTAPSPAAVAAARPLAEAAVAAFRTYAEGKAQLAHMVEATAAIVHPGVLADAIAAHAVTASVAERQAVLEIADPVRRLEMAVALIATPGARAA